jgi:hypothetical protein
MENIKYLGVTINNKLNWTQHITNIKGKASRTLGFLQRNLGGCKSNVLSIVLADVVVSGSLFQSVVVLGKKENL